MAKQINFIPDIQYDFVKGTPVKDAINELKAHWGTNNTSAVLRRAVIEQNELEKHKKSTSRRFRITPQHDKE